MTAEALLNDTSASESFSSLPLAEEGRAAFLLRPPALEAWARQEGALGDLIVQEAVTTLSGIAKEEIHIGHYTWYCVSNEVKQEGKGMKGKGKKGKKVGAAAF